MYAIVKVSGKQYRVEDGAQILVDRLDAEEGAGYENFQVLMIGDGDNTQIGTPVVAGARVAATVVRHAQGKKIHVFKYKAKKNYRRRKGARAQQTLLRIDNITV